MKLKAKLKSTSQNSENHKGKMLVTLTKGVLVALGFSLVGILLFAFVLKFTNISEGVITPINQIIKGVSILLGVGFALRKQREAGLLKGMLIGIIYTLVAFLTFSILGGHFAFDASLGIDAAFGAIIGAICGIICVNLKKSSI